MLAVAPITLKQPHYDTLQKYEKYREWARKERKKTIGRVNKLTVASERVDKLTVQVNKLTVTSERVDCYE